MISESFCYSLFFQYLFKHNNGLSFLVPEEKKSRNRSNAQTMMGQFYFFITETFYLIFIFVAFSVGGEITSLPSKDIAVIYKTIEFGLISVGHCLLIPEIRRFIVKWFLGIFSFNLKIFCCSKKPKSS